MAYTDSQKTDHIRELQRYLHGISYYDAQIPRILPDGIYGPETTSAVRAFQNAYGLTGTGEANRATWERIAQVYRDFYEVLARALEVFPRDRSQVITIGDTGLPVLVIQSILRVLAERYHNLPLTEVTGLYGTETGDAVRAFQTLTALPVTGSVDLYTWNQLALLAGELTGR